MTHHSGADLDPSTEAAPVVPLSDRPLISDDQNTVISSGIDGDDSVVDLVPDLNLSAQEIRDRMFPPAGSPPGTEEGLQIAHFRLERRIGAGGMGAVFLAQDLQLSRPVALKVLSPKTSSDVGFIARFRNEARACAQLNHDNIARVYFSGQHEGIHFIAYEYVDGMNVKQVIEHLGKLSTEQTVNYAIQVTLALAHVHHLGVVHRDVKPSNIILTQAGRIKVVDLGLAKRETEDSVGDLTVAGTTLGTFDYMAPEQARDAREADIRSDIYSLGCSMFHMLTGQPPYPDGTAVQKMMDHQAKDPPDPRTENADIPVEMANITKKMMAAEPDERYQDPGQLLFDLTSLATKLGVKCVPAEGMVWRRVPVRRVRDMSGAIFLAGAVLAICAAALTMHLVPQRGQSDQQLQQLIDSLGVSQEATELVADSDPDVRPAGSNVETVEGSPQQIEEPVIPTPETLEPSKQIIVESADGAQSPTDSLADAWANAQSGDVITLDFDGPWAESLGSMPQPADTSGPAVTIRAAAGRKPVLKFDGEIEDNQPFPGRLFHLTNGVRLRLQGIQLLVSIRPEVPADEWTLFELTGTNGLELSDCLIDVENSARVSTAVIRLSETQTTFFEDQGASVRLDNVVVRGTCEIVVVSSLSANTIQLDQSAFVTEGAIIRNLGSADGGAPSETDVKLKHVTALGLSPAFVVEDSGVLDSDADPERTLSVLKISSEACVFGSLADSGLFVSSAGNNYVPVLEDLIRWKGRSNLYHGYDSFWSLASGKRGVPSEPILYDFDEWSRLWSGITSAEETDAVESEVTVWNSPEMFSEAPDPLTISTSDLKLRRDAFFGAEAQYSPHEGQVPGASVHLFKALDVAPAVSTAEEMDTK